MMFGIRNLKKSEHQAVAVGGATPTMARTRTAIGRNSFHQTWAGCSRRTCKTTWQHTSSHGAHKRLRVQHHHQENNSKEYKRDGDPRMHRITAAPYPVLRLEQLSLFVCVHQGACKQGNGSGRISPQGTIPGPQEHLHGTPTVATTQNAAPFSHSSPFPGTHSR
jgi:hypothetical protein